MKIIVLALILALTSCGQNSSPEGRLSIKMDAMHQEIDSLKKQNTMILDSLNKMNQSLQKLKQSGK
ncbi:hypothetical protein [Runella sp.]|jgi:hypothetical protein|uniref:hypothetical protein n=1 Tax=Runella sp. TaxID=1960881 RepID=UPI00263640B4|nr:hypothetical protein [Runella sp.]